MALTWTYGGDLTTDKDWIRFTIGDTDVNSPLLYDEEITALLLNASKTKVAITSMEAILGKLSRECNYKIGPEAVSASDRYKQYQEFYQKTKATLVQSKLVPQAPQAPTGALGAPIFDIGMMDNYSSDSGVN